MAPKNLLSFFVFLLVLALPASLVAQDVFVRPNAGSAATPPAVDYGVKARPQAPAPAPGVAPGVKPSTTPSVAQPQPQQPAPVVTPQPVDTSSPQPGSPTRGSVEVQQINKDVSILKISDDPKPRPGKGPNSITINYKGGAVGPQDKNNIMRTLGLSDKEVQENCFFRYSAYVNFGRSDIGILQSGTAPSVTYKYTAPLGKITVFPTVACRIMHVPAYGTIIEQNGYYLSSLASAECNPGDKANGNPTLNFSYTGDGTGQCLFQ